jgi:hypothetical protein
VKVTNVKTQTFKDQPSEKSSPKLKPNEEKESSPAVYVDIRKQELHTVKENKPEDPTVSAKVLDSLQSGMIDFNQKQRETIAVILSEKSQNIQDEE